MFVVAVNAPVGIPIVDESTFDERTMWSPRSKTPFFLLILPNLLTLGIWGFIIYLINNLFTHPYTKIEFVQRDLQVSRITATKYLEALTAGGFLKKQKMGRGNYYINIALNSILVDLK